MNLIFLGPPGAGKGTLAGLVGREYGIPQISTGDLFRESVRGGTELGRKVKQIMDRGDLVPDDLTVALVKERLALPDAHQGFILDGFPRTIPQADALGKIARIDAVANFQVDDETVIRRLSGRRICRKCGAIYHVENIPPQVEGVCDRCGGELYTRSDDQIDAIRKRLQVYKQQTEPLIRYYRKKGLLRDIDASADPEHTLQQIRAALRPSGEQAG